VAILLFVVEVEEMEVGDEEVEVVVTEVEGKGELDVMDEMTSTTPPAEVVADVGGN
jgi:hypothetical protein